MRREQNKQAQLKNICDLLEVVVDIVELFVAQSIASVIAYERH